MEECRVQQQKSDSAETPLPDCAVAEPQTGYGAELFEKYQEEQGTERADRITGRAVTPDIEKSR